MARTRKGNSDSPPKIKGYGIAGKLPLHNTGRRRLLAFQTLGGSYGKAGHRGRVLAQSHAGDASGTLGPAGPRRRQGASSLQGEDLYLRRTYPIAQTRELRGEDHPRGMAGTASTLPATTGF